MKFPMSLRRLLDPLALPLVGSDIADPVVMMLDAVILEVNEYI